MLHERVWPWVQALDALDTSGQYRICHPLNPGLVDQGEKQLRSPKNQENPSHVFAVCFGRSWGGSRGAAGTSAGLIHMALKEHLLHDLMRGRGTKHERSQINSNYMELEWKQPGRLTYLVVITVHWEFTWFNILYQK